MPKISKRGGFSDRNKIKPINTEIQLKDFDKRTRIQLQNMISRFYKYVYEDEDTYYVKEAVQEFFRYVIGTIYSEPIDMRRRYYYDDVLKMIFNTIQEDDFDDVLTLIEAIIQYFDEYLVKTRRDSYYDRFNQKYVVNSLFKIANIYFKQEYVGYRFVDKIIVPISDQNEITEIEEVLECRYAVVRNHISKANILLADRENPDYENSIKESISAVEAICEILTGIKGKEEIMIPDINLKKQCEYANVLEKIHAAIQMRKQELKHLDFLLKARFVEMFGDVIHNDRKWECRKFSDITASRLGKMLDTKHQTGTCQYSYLANFNVQWFGFELKNLNKMDFNEKDREEFCLEDGDLLVCEGGEIGRCAVWHNQVENCFFQKALHRVRCNQEIILPDYLAWWFKYNCDHGGFVAIEGAKATISHLTGAKMKMLNVTVPPIGLQKQFTSFVNQVDKSKVAVQKALDETQILFDSLMQKYFG